jgi:hypothetical protein
MASVPPAPDDDPLFGEWLADVGPIQRHPADLPEVAETVGPLAAALAMLIGGAGIVAALGWAAYGFAVDLDVHDTGALVLLIVGTVLVVTGGVFTAATHHRRCR